MDKFNGDYTALYNSYLALEKQFTKKCQEVANMEKSGTNVEQTPPQTAPMVTLGEFLTKYPDAAIYRDQLVLLAPDPMTPLPEQTFATGYIDQLKQAISVQTTAKNTETCDEVGSGDAKTDQVAAQVTPAVLSIPVTISGNGGNIVKVSPIRPKTISEASELAKKLF
jgi:hypothetical protein